VLAEVPTGFTNRIPRPNFQILRFSAYQVVILGYCLITVNPNLAVHDHSDYEL
jgi:hypothetical protein